MIVAIINQNKIENVGDIKELFSHVSFPPSGPESEWMEKNNVKVVTYWKPHDRLTEKLVSVDPYIEDENVFAVEVQNLTDDEVANIQNTRWIKVRADRDKRLDRTDWIVAKALEAGEIVPSMWVEYRQALRDITLQDDPFNIVWPTKPE